METPRGWVWPARPHILGLPPNPQLLGLFVATAGALTYFGAHFAVIGHASPEGTPYEAVHRWGKGDSRWPLLGRGLQGTSRCQGG